LPFYYYFLSSCLLYYIKEAKSIVFSSFGEVVNEYSNGNRLLSIVVKQVLLLIIHTNQTVPKSKNIYPFYYIISHIYIHIYKKNSNPFHQQRKVKGNTLVGDGGGRHNDEYYSTNEETKDQH
jgi:hypothetical protein